MKVATGGNPVTRSGVLSENHFSIKGSAKAFDILSSGLYTDPVTAVIRELSCNAFDAHTAAGRDTTPILIHLPNRLEPFFSVKDEGIGLSDEDVQGMYSTYFESTKSESNDQIGGFGLGSKSPFSYSKAFEVISVHDGHRRTYSIFVDEEGVPTIALLNTIASDEHPGLEVKISVKDGDYDQFERKTARVLRFFPVRPTIVGVVDFAFEAITDDKTTQLTNAIVRQVNYNRDQLTVVQGNVPYDVNWYDINTHLSSETRVFFEHFCATILLDIGEVEVAANRESIRITPETVEVIKTRTEALRLEFLVTIEDEVAKCLTTNSTWDAFSVLNTHFDSMGKNIHRMMEGFTPKTKAFQQWNDARGKITIEGLTSDALKYHTIKTFVTGRGDKAYNSKGDFYDGYTVYPKENKVIMVDNDVTVRHTIRINNLLREAPGRPYALTVTPLSLRVINKKREALKEAPLTKLPSFRKERNMITKVLGNPTFVTLSEETTDVRPASSTSGGARGPKAKFKRFIMGASAKKYSSPIRLADEHTPPNDGLYLEVNSTVKCVPMYKGASQDHLRSHNTMKDHLEHILSLTNSLNGTAHQQVYVVNTRTAKTLKDDGQWTNVFDLYQATLDAAPDLFDAFTFTKRLRDTTTYGWERFLREGELSAAVKETGAGSTFNKMFEPIVEGHEAMATYSNLGIRSIDISQIQYYAESLRLTLKHKLVKGDKFFEYHDLCNAYPMLTHMGNVHTDKEFTEALDYIKLVDGQ